MKYDWIISDTHFFHKNIAEYAGRPLDHNELMVENWRSMIKPTDHVLHLGDVLMGQREMWPTLGWLPGLVDVLSTGNHDEPHKVEFLKDRYHWIFIPEFDIEYRGWKVYFSHVPLWTIQVGNNNTNVKVDKVPPRSINIHGHIHQKAAPSEHHVNVCVELTDYKPVKLQELLDRKIDELQSW